VRWGDVSAVNVATQYAVLGVWTREWRLACYKLSPPQLWLAADAEAHLVVIVVSSTRDGWDEPDLPPNTRIALQIPVALYDFPEL
jgi:hypothetical protein